MPLNPAQMKQVADKVTIPLAAGERIYWRWGYRPFPGKRQPERWFVARISAIPRRHHRRKKFAIWRTFIYQKTVQTMFLRRVISAVRRRYIWKPRSPTSSTNRHRRRAAEPNTDL